MASENLKGGVLMTSSIIIRHHAVDLGIIFHPPYYLLGFKLIRLFAIDHEGITKIKNVEVLMRPRFAIAVLLVASLGASQVISKIKLTINSHKHSFFVHYYLRCFGSLICNWTGGAY